MEEVKKKVGRPRKSGMESDEGPTELQQKTLANMASGDYRSFRQAALAAGYNDRGMNYKRFIAQKGVQKFLKEMDKKSMEKYGTTVTEKIMDVFMDALKADKIVGRHDMRIEDHRTRVEVASKIASIMNLTQPVQQTIINNNTTNEQKNIQYNYFSTPQEDKKAFTKSFIDFVNNYKKPDGPDVDAREGIAKREVEEGEIAN